MLLVSRWARGPECDSFQIFIFRQEFGGETYSHNFSYILIYFHNFPYISRSLPSFSIIFRKVPTDGPHGRRTVADGLRSAGPHGEGQSCAQRQQRPGSGGPWRARGLPKMWIQHDLYNIIQPEPTIRTVDLTYLTINMWDFTIKTLGFSWY